MSIAEARGQGGSAAGNDPFLTALQGKLMSQSDLISSSNTGIEDKINEAIKGVNSANASSAAALDSSFGREFDFRVANAEFARTGAMDSRTGYATNNAFIRNLDLNTEKSLKDLDQRKQELILQGDAAAASKISELQLKGLEFKQQAEQQAFSNLLALGGFGIQQKQLDQGQQQIDNQKSQFETTTALAERKQNFDEKSAISSIALQYGVTVGPDDTIETIVTKAAPFASAKQQLELEQIRASISASKATVAKAYADMNENKALDAASLEALARTYQNNPNAVLGVVKTTAQLGQILGKVGEISYSDNKGLIDGFAKDGTPLKTVVENLSSSTSLSPDQKAQLIDYANTAYKDVPQYTPGVTLGGIGRGVWSAKTNAENALANFGRLN